MNDHGNYWVLLMLIGAAGVPAEDDVTKITKAIFSWVFLVAGTVGVFMKWGAP